ncbi:MAG: IPT/TIG domain-containing protein [Vicinamibacterales bacterium]
MNATIPDGATSGSIIVTTPFGTNTSTTTFTAAPVILSFTPGDGPAGTSVKITGYNFATATAVRFNGSAATYAIVSDTEVDATVPKNATSGPVAVAAPAGTVTSTTPFAVLPQITTFSPNSGKAGSSVVITGTELAGVTEVRFNGQPAAFTIVSPTSIRAIVPTGNGSGPITVTSADGTATSAASFDAL